MKGLEGDFIGVYRVQGLPKMGIPFLGSPREGL